MTLMFTDYTKPYVFIILVSTGRFYGVFWKICALHLKMHATLRCFEILSCRKSAYFLHVLLCVFIQCIFEEIEISWCSIFWKSRELRRHFILYCKLQNNWIRQFSHTRCLDFGKKAYFIPCVGLLLGIQDVWDMILDSQQMAWF